MLLNFIQSRIQEFAKIDPINMLQMDQTNRYSWGKVMIHVDKISNFPYSNNIFVKISIGPWVVQTKRVLNEKLDFNQTFFVPIPHSFATLKLEVINL